jgi:hypothetical protein
MLLFRHICPCSDLEFTLHLCSGSVPQLQVACSASFLVHYLLSIIPQDSKWPRSHVELPVFCCVCARLQHRLRLRYHQVEKQISCIINIPKSFYAPRNISGLRQAVPNHVNHDAAAASAGVGQHSRSENRPCRFLAAIDSEQLYFIDLSLTSSAIPFCCWLVKRLVFFESASCSR